MGCRDTLKFKGSGFTLAELIVVVASISSLTAIAAPNFLDYVLKSQNVKATMYLQDMKKQVLSYHLETGKFPADVNANLVPPRISGVWHTSSRMPFNASTDYEHWYVGAQKCLVLIGWFGKDGVRDYPIHRHPPNNLEEMSDDQVITIAEYHCRHQPRSSIR